MAQFTRREVLGLASSAMGLAVLAPLLGCSGNGDESAFEPEAGETVEVDEAETPVEVSEAAYVSHDTGGPTVFFTPDISSAGLVAAYQALGVTLPEKVGVKISTGQGSHSNYLRPELISDLVHLVGGDIVECNTAFTGSRGITESHYRVIEERGFPTVASTIILDESADMELPVTVGKHLSGKLS